MNIFYQKRQEIDDDKWNRMVDRSSNGLLYSTTFFLDGICTNWDAIVVDDYEHVMPLPWRRKFGIRYLYQPVGLAQGGITSVNQISPEIEKKIIEKVLTEFKYGRTNLNETFNPVDIPGCKIENHNNFILDLRRPYHKTVSGYNEDGRKNLRRADRVEQSLAFDSTPAETLSLYLSQYESRITNKKLISEYRRFATFLDSLVNQGLAFNACVRGGNSALYAAAVFGKYKNRLYYLFGAPGDKGRGNKSVHFLLDKLIQQYSGFDFVLDFEGSEIPSVATFYKKFGPVNKPYKILHFNNLPGIAKQFKRS